MRWTSVLVRMSVLVLLMIAARCIGLSLMSAGLGVAGCFVPLLFVTIGYAVFQTANTTAVTTNFGRDRGGVGTGLLNVSRNLGLIPGASAMGVTG